MNKWSFCDIPSKIEWSPDSSLILIGLFKRGCCEIKIIDNCEWNCKIEEVILINLGSSWYGICAIFI
jgi:hypothetical protein